MGENVFDMNPISCVYTHFGTMVIQKPGNKYIIMINMINSGKKNSRLNV